MLLTSDSHECFSRAQKFNDGVEDSKSKRSQTESDYILLSTIAS